MASPKTLTTDETDKLLYELYWHPKVNKPPRKSIRNYTICLLMLDAGLRVGEVVYLHMSDLYFNSQPVTSIIIRPEIAKNNAERIIPVSQRLSNALKTFLEYNTPSGQNWTLAYAFRKSNDWNHLTTRQVERIIRSAAMKSLGRPVHPHVLRHTFATRMMRVTDMRTVQEALGHKNISSTQVYTHPNQEDLKKAIDGIDIRAIVMGEENNS